MRNGILKKIRKKMRSSDGVTILLALLFFMLCSVVGSIILSASTAASGRLASLRTQEQKYYESSAAATFVEDMFEDVIIAVDGQDYYALDKETVNGLDLEYGEIPQNYQEIWQQKKLTEGDLFEKLLDNRGSEQNFILKVNTGIQDSRNNNITLAYDIRLTADNDYGISGTVQLQNDSTYSYDVKIPADTSTLYVEEENDTNTTQDSAESGSPSTGSQTSGSQTSGSQSGGESVNSGSTAQSSGEEEQKEIIICRWKDAVITLNKESDDKNGN